MSFWKRIGRWFQRPVERDHRLTATAESFRLTTDGELVYDVAWADVQKVVAYKVDLFTVDEIRMELTTVETDPGVWVINEEIPGFWDVAEELKRQLPDSHQSWEHEVIQPPFETCFTTIFPLPEHIPL